MVLRAKLKIRHHPFAPYRIMDVPLFLEQAIQQHQRGKVDEAYAIYRRILATVPNHADALHFMGLAEFQKGQPARALELMNQSIQLEPNHADYLNNRGNVHRFVGNRDEAEADYYAALELCPTHADALNNVGVVLRDRGDITGAIAQFQLTVEHHPSHADAYVNLGGSLAAIQRYDEALEAYRAALHINPNDARAYRHVAAMCYATGKLDEATAMYRAWLDHTPDDPVAQHLLAACTGQGVPERASNDYVRTTFDDYADSFDSSLERLEYRAPTLVAKAAEALSEAAQGTLCLLDAGCGTGLVAPFLRPLSRSLIGVDLSPKMLDKARTRHLYDELIEAELHAYLLTQSARFDAIVSADTLVYFGNLEAVIDGFHQALVPQGWLVFTVEHALPEDAPEGYCIHPHGRYSHTTRYVKRRLSESGFVDITAKRVTLRKEAGKWVDGLLVTARKPATL